MEVPLLQTSAGPRELTPISLQTGRNLAMNHPAFATHDSMLRDYLRILIKRKWIVLGSMGIIFGASLIASSAQYANLRCRRKHCHQ